MARSIVSMGTDASRALVTAERSDALVVVSLPPSRAATSTSRMSLANVFARAASAAPFLCLIVAHLLWPLILQPPSASAPLSGPRFLLIRSQTHSSTDSYSVQEQLMDTQVVG